MSMTVTLACEGLADLVPEGDAGLSAMTTGRAAMRDRARSSGQKRVEEREGVAVRGEGGEAVGEDDARWRCRGLRPHRAMDA